MVSTSLATFSVFSLITVAFSEISCIVAESSSVKAERSETLLLLVCTLWRTSSTTLSILAEFVTTALKMVCSFVINTFIPFATASTSALDIYPTLCVRSPFLLSMLTIIPSISFCVLESGLITIEITESTTTKSAATLTTIVTTHVTTEARYVLSRLCLSFLVFSVTLSLICEIAFSILFVYLAIEPFATP